MRTFSFNAALYLAQDEKLKFIVSTISKVYIQPFNIKYKLLLKCKEVKVLPQPVRDKLMKAIPNHTENGCLSDTEQDYFHLFKMNQSTRRKIGPKNRFYYNDSASCLMWLC